MMKDRKTFPPTYLLISIVAMAVLHFLLSARKIIPSPWNALGIVPIALGVAINIVADDAFRRAQTTVKPFEESTTLVMSGVFQISRNPMYLGFVLILVGVAVLMGSLTPYFVIPVFVILMDRVFIQVEEEMLEEKFGSAWLDYETRVGRWI
jgi:protein-S-isoprenylcysteine O-methyltransferase Ste14